MLRVLLLLLVSILAVPRTSAYTLKIPPEESTTFRLVPTSGRDYAVTLFGRRIFLLTKKGSTIWNPAISGMTGTLSNGVAVLRCPNFAGEPATLTFTNGVLSRISRKKGTAERKSKDAKMVRLNPTGKNPLLGQWSPKKDKEIDYWAYWKAQKGFKRLRLWFFNPNGAGTFFAELALIAFAAVFLLKRVPLRLASGILFAAFLWCELKTGSRGAFIGLFAGTVITALLAVKRAFSWKKAFVFGGALLLVSALVWAGVFGTRMGQRLFAMDWSNLERLRIWREAPRMLAAAPGGWGVNQSGPAFCDWFQNAKTFHPLAWLVNSHLTWIVELGCWFCAVYVFAWLSVLVFSLRAAWRGSGSGMVVAGLTVLMLISAWFSTVGVFVTLWILPGIALAVLLVKVFRDFHRSDAIILAVLLLVSAAVPFAVVQIGRGMAPAAADFQKVARAGGLTVVGEGEPLSYLVPDEEMLSMGGGMGRDVRKYRARHPKATTFAIADNLGSLPDKPMELLVLAGRSGVDFLNLRRAHLSDGKYPRADKIIFLSPPFTPDAIPQSLLAGGGINIVYGEFSQRLSDKLRKLPLWVHIAKGGELYIPGWVRFMEVEK